jgi:hypothetical protein
MKRYRGLVLWHNVMRLWVRCREATNARCARLWHWLEILRLSSWTSPQQEWIRKPVVLCGKWLQKSLRGNRVRSSSPLTAWKKRRRFQLRWLSWLRAAFSSALEAHSTSEISLVQATWLKSKSGQCMRMNFLNCGENTFRKVATSQCLTITAWAFSVPT